MSNAYLPQKAEIISVFHQTDIDATFRLKSDIQPQSGQFLQLSIPKVGEAPISISDFGEGYLDMTIRKVGKVTDVIHQLQSGDYMFIRGPYGKGFPLEKYHGKHLIIAAGGTGLAPVKSVISHFYRHSELIKGAEIMAGFKSPQDILFKDELAKWQDKFSTLVTVDRGDENWQGNVGLITQYISSLDFSHKDNTIVIVVGPPLMMKFTCQEFVCQGIKEENIWVSFERKMSCGIGKCGHCKINETYVCLEGPVFHYPDAVTLLD